MTAKKLRFGRARSSRAVWSCLLALGAFARPGVARADVSSWVFVGGGVSRLRQKDLSARTVPVLRMQFGMGSSPAHPLVLGGLFSIEPNIGHGTDLAVYARAASRGYVTGKFGLALDAGPYARFWGANSAGASGMLWLGAPWGLGLGVGGSIGGHDARAFSAVLGFDFARLTVYRASGTSWFLNPFPSPR